MKTFAKHEKNSATVSQMEGIFVITVFRNHQHSHCLRSSDAVTDTSFGNNVTLLLDLILSLWFFQYKN